MDDAPPPAPPVVDAPPPAPPVVDAPPPPPVEKPAPPPPPAAAPAPTPAKKAAPPPPPPAAREGRGRVRKTVEFFQPEVIKKPDKLVVGEGKGTKLADIPNVAFLFSKVKGDDPAVKELHNIMYRRPGKGTTRKRDVLAFSGFPDGAAAAAGKDVERVSRVKGDVVHRMLDLLDVPRGGGSKDDKVKRLLAFLAAPAPTPGARDLAAADAKKKAAAVRKRAKASGGGGQAKKAKPAAPAKQAKKKAAASSDDDESSSESESEPESDDDEASSSSGSEPDAEAAPKPTTARARAAAAAKKAPPPPPPPPPAAAPEPAAPEPAADPAAPPLPPFGEVKARALALLATADMASFSVKQLVAALSAHFNADLKPIKAQIKEVALEFCAAAAPAAAEPEAAAE